MKPERLLRRLFGPRRAASRPAEAWSDPVLLLEDRIMLDAEAAVSISGPPLVPLGGSFAVTLTFDNQPDSDPGSATGYGPYIDLFVPATGKDGDDGIQFGSATYLGAPVQSTVLTFDALGQIIHPFARDASGNPRIVTGTPGDTLVVLTLPFGSFTPEQTPAAIAVNLNLSALADYDPAHVTDRLTLSAQGGFFLGRDPLDNPVADPPVLQSPPVSLTVSPSLVTLGKTADAPEDETATGPNFLRTYVIELDIATGQTIDSLRIEDLLPSTIVYLGSSVTLGPGVLAEAPVVGAAVDPLANLLAYDFGRVTGVDGVDARITVSFHVAETSGGAGGMAVLDPLTGAPSQTVNDVRATGLFLPLDGRDPQTLVVEDATAIDNVIVNRAIAVQKTSSIIDTGAPGLSAGDGIIYTIAVQLSDYFTLGDLELADLLSDGQRIDTSFVPVFNVIERGTSTGATAFSGLVVSGGEFTGAGFSTLFDPVAGTTAIRIGLSQELISQGLLGGDGVLAGGRTQPGDAALGTAATTMTVTFRAIVQQAFVAPQPGGQIVAQGDSVGNRVEVSATVRDNATTVPTGATITDDSSAVLRVPTGQLSVKDILAVNGTAPVLVGGFPQITQGDSITFRLTYVLPNSALEDSSIIDFLPLPILPAGALTKSAAAPGVLPQVGEWNYGANDSFSALPNAPEPVVSAQAGANSITFAYGGYALQLQPGNPAPQASVIELLFTVAVADLPFADDLQLTNLATASERGSQGPTVATNAITQFQFGQPELTITKGVVDHLGSGSVTFDGSRAPPGVSFAGAAGNTGPAAFSGTITDAALALGAIDANLRGADAGDKVTFAIVLNNNGTGRNGAFDVQFRDTLPAGFAIPTDVTGLNLKVTTGNGTPVAYTALAGGLFGSGLQLTDPGSTGAIAADTDGSASSGTSSDDIIVITYDLVALDTVQPRQTWTNEAVLFSYAARAGGTDFLTTDLVDSATVRTPDPRITKTVFATSETFTSGNVLAIGETVTFRVSVTLPEGTVNNLVLSDFLPANAASILAPVSATLISVGSGLSGPGIPAIGSSGTLSGQQFSFDFGSVVNAGDNVAGNDSILFEVIARAIDDPRNGRADTATNRGQIDWVTTLEDGGTIAGVLTANASVRLATPDLTLVKSVSPTQADGGDIVTYQLVVANPANAFATTAFDVNLVDSDLAALGFTEVTITGVSSSGAVNAAATADAGGVVRVSADSLNAGGTITVTFSARVSDTVIAGSTLTNVARITDYATLPGGDPNARVITDEPPATATLQIAQPGAAKVLVTTSIGDDADPKVQIGETATFDLIGTLPDGVTESLVVRDILPTGASTLQFVSAQLISIGGNMVAGATSGGNISGSLIGVGADGVLSADLKTATFNFGTLFNNALLPGAEADRIVIRVTVLVPDVPENSAADDIVTNTALATFSTGSATATSSLDIIEPDVRIAKSGTPPELVAGTVVDYSFVLENVGDGVAYDLTVADPLHPDLVLVPGSIRFSGVASGTAASFADIMLAQLRPGEQLTVTYQAMVQDTAVLGSSIVNTATTAYDSLPGISAVGRVPDPLPSSTVSLPVNGTVVVDKALILTSVGLDADPNVVIGEVVTYQITATLPDGTSNLSFQDLLPPGLFYVPGSAAFVSAFGDPTLPPDFDVVVAGQTVNFAFGTLVNPAVVGGDNRVIVTLQALVQDVPGNVAGLNLINAVSATTNNGTVFDPTPPIVTIVVPRLELDKQVVVNGGTAGDAGDIATFTLAVRHTGTSSADARDFVIEDVLPAGLTLVGGPVLSGSGAPGAVIDPSPPANGLRVTGATLARGDTLLISFMARIDDANLLPSTLLNSATLGWDSLPGPGGRPDSGTGSATVDVTGPQQFVKRITATSDGLTGSGQFDPSVTDLVIGERIDLELRATVPEGVLGPVLVSDTLLAGFGTLELLPGTVTVEIGGVAASYVLSVVDTNADGIDDRLLFDLGTIALPGDNDPANNDIVIRYTAVVPDIASNAAGPGRVLLLPAVLDTPLGARSSAVSVEVVEPVLVLDKIGSAISGSPGDVITYRITLAHAGESTAAARDISLTDNLSTGDLVLVPGSLVVLSGPGVVTGPGVSVSIPTLELNAETVIEYQAIIGSVPPGAAVPNVAAAAFDSAEGPGGRPDLVTDTYTFGVPNIDKLVTGTGLVDTGSEQFRPTLVDLAIGELLFYDLVVTLPTGSTSILVTDSLLGLGDTGVLELVGTPSIALGAGVSADNPNPTPVFTDTDGDGRPDRIAWDFGTVSFTGIGENRIVISVVTQVPDIAANDNGSLLILPASLDYGSGFIVDVIGADLVEPDIRVSKTVVPGVAEAGVLVGYEVVLRNLGEGPGYGMLLSDVAAAGLVAEGPATLVIGGVTTSFASVNDVSVARLLPGEVATVTYSARVADSVLVGTVLPNVVTTGFGSLPGVGGGGRDYGPVSDGADVTLAPSTAVTLAKAIPVPPTSNPDTGDGAVRAGVTDLGIGETAQVTLTAVLPRGTVSGVVLSDDLASAAGQLGFVAGSLSVTLGGVLLDPSSYSLSTIDGNGDGIADRIELRFASLTVPGSADPAAFPLVVRYTATALDIAGNAGGDQLDLPASLTFTTANGPIAPVTASASADLVEPELEIEKTVVRTVGDSGSLNGLLPPGLPGEGTAGDIFTYTLTLRQLPGATGPAHDISVSDALPAGLEIVAGSLVSTLPGVTLSASGTTVTATAPLVRPGETFTISYQARILDSTGYGTDLPNRADIGWDSLPGPGGRAGADSDSAGVRLAGAGTVVKTVIDTSNPNSGSNAFDPEVTDLTIGELVTMRLTATLAEGTTRVVITDRLPTGPTGVLALVGVSAPLLGANVRAEFPNPTPTLADSDGDGLVDSLTFDFGQVTVLGDNVIDERDTISIEVTARVPDDPRNASGNRLDAPVLLDFGTGSDRASIPFDIVEPRLIVDKTALTPDRFLGQIASYEIRVFHAPNSLVAADVAVIDTLSPGLTLVPGSLIVVASPPGVPVTISGTSVSVPLLPLGTELVIRFDAQIAFSVNPTVPLSNTATVSWDQVPGPGGRPATAEDTAVIGILPGDFERDEEKAGQFLDDRHIERLPRIDAIYSGTAKPGARLVLTLADDRGTPAGTAAVTADAGGNWVALMPLAQMSSESDIGSARAGSRLFADTIGQSFQSALWDSARDVRVGAFVADSAHSLRIDSLSAGHVQPDNLLDGEPELNLRTYFAPAWRDVPQIDAAPAVGRVFEELAAQVVASRMEAARTPIGFGVNRFNAEMLATGVASR